MTTTTNEANKEEEDDDYDLLYGDVGDFSDDFEERKTTLTTKRSGTTHDAIETGTDGDFAIGKKGRTDEDQNQEDQGRTTKEHERGFGEKEEEDKTEEDDDDTAMSPAAVVLVIRAVPTVAVLVVRVADSIFEAVLLDGRLGVAVLVLVPAHHCDRRAAQLSSERRRHRCAVEGARAFFINKLACSAR